MLGLLKKTLTKKYILYLFFGFFWLPIIVFGSLNIKLISSLVENDNKSYLRRAVEAQNKSVESFIKDNFEQVTSIANRRSIFELIKSDDSQNNYIATKDFNLLHGLFVTKIGIYDNKGLSRSSSNSNDISKSFADKAYYQMTILNQRSQMTVNSADKISPEIIFSAPIYGQNNQVVGVLAIHYSLAVIQEVISSHRDLAGSGSYGIILNSLDEVIGTTNSFDLDFPSLKSFNAEVDSLYRRAIVSNSNFHSKEDISIVVSSIKLSKWRSIYIQPANAFVGSVHNTMNNFMAIMALVFILALSSSYLIYLLILRIRSREDQLKIVNDEIMVDLQLGFQVQKALQYTPRLPDSIDFVSYQQAAKYVSGDLSFTYMNSALNIFTFMIIDVNGKGVQAALKASAFSSIAKSVWTSSESYGEGKDRFAIFRGAAQKFVQNTDFKEDFLAVIGCEYHIDSNELFLYRLNYTAPFMIELDEEHQNSVRSLNIPNDKVCKAILDKNQAVILLGDAFIESSRSEKKLIRSLNRGLSVVPYSFTAENLCQMVRDVPLENQFEDDQTILVLKNRGIS